MTDVKKGLEGVVIADSSIATVNGQQGLLSYRGYDITDLAEHSTFEETLYLLWMGELPASSQLDSFSARLAAERDVDENVWRLLTAFPCWPLPMEALRTAVSSISSCDPEANDDSDAANLNKAIRLAAKMPTVVAYYFRHSEGRPRVPPVSDLSHAGNFLYMLRGEAPSPAETRAMDLMLILMAEHGMNASTFAARVTASTLSDMYSAITSAIGTLKGPLHGGANQRAMEMLLEIGSIENVEPYIKDKLAKKERVMGIGHRVYKVIDPRAKYLSGMLCDVGSASAGSKWCEMALRVAEIMEAEKGLYPNVDFYTAPLLHTLGIPLDMFTAVFAISRIAGWVAHVMEQYKDNRLIRPRANYIGPALREYVPLERRG